VYEYAKTNNEMRFRGKLEISHIKETAAGIKIQLVIQLKFMIIVHF